MERLPQVLINVPGVDRGAVCGTDEVARRRVADAEASSATPAGCCCARRGTEPLVRVMVEAPTAEQAQRRRRAARREVVRHLRSAV